jgi:TPR repeat protein
MNTKKFKAVLLVTTFLSLTATISYSQDFETGLSAYEARDYQAARAEWIPLAQEGNANAQFRLGILYQLTSALGLEEPEVYTEGIKWIHEAAVQGHANAQHELGLAYLKGKGVPQDYLQAAEWLKVAADQSFSLSQYELGVLFRDGTGVSQDFAAATSWFQLAAEQGHLDAQNNLGARYLSGQGVQQDFEMAFFWFSSSAKKGNSLGQSNLGAMYSNGQGVSQNLSKAYMWLTLATNDDYKLRTTAETMTDSLNKKVKSPASAVDQWNKNLVMLEGYMTQAEVADAKAKATQCLGSEYREC